MLGINCIYVFLLISNGNEPFLSLGFGSPQQCSGDHGTVSEELIGFSACKVRT